MSLLGVEGLGLLWCRALGLLAFQAVFDASRQQLPGALRAELMPTELCRSDTLHDNGTSYAIFLVKGTMSLSA